eukprot:1038744-Pleurochrysis_carterae.AAC.1
MCLIDFPESQARLFKNDSSAHDHHKFPVILVWIPENQGQGRRSAATALRGAQCIVVSKVGGIVRRRRQERRQRRRTVSLGSAATC